MFAKSISSELRDLFIEAGLNEKLFDQAAKKISKVAMNCLIKTFQNLPASMRENISNDWELICMSEDKKALTETLNLSTLKNNLNENPIHYSALSGCMEQYDAALSASCAFEEKIKNGYNILHYAALGGSKKILEKALIQADNKLSLTTDDNKTLLHFAAMSGKYPIVKFIIDNKLCNPDAKDKAGKNALDYAGEQGNVNVAYYLKTLGLKPTKVQESIKPPTI